MRTRSAATAASRYGGRCVESGRLSHTLAALEMRDGTREQIAHLLGRELAVQQSVTGDGDRRGLFRHDQDGVAGVLREADRGAVARSERFDGELELRERQHAPYIDDLVQGHDDRGGWQRG